MSHPLRTVNVPNLVQDAGLEPSDVYELARRTLDEDLAGGVDVTTQSTIPVGHESTGDVVARSNGTVAGIPVAAAVFDVRLAGRGRVEAHSRDGSRVRPGTAVLTVAGPTRELLTAERAALNLLCHLSGVATLTRAWADAVGSTRAVIRDTRKTTPGLRALEKYAVRCGGGQNHRMGLAEEALIKDNHVRSAGGIAPALAAVRQRCPDIACEVECDTLEEVAEALRAGARVILLDNMSVADTRTAVMLARGYGARTEASGRLTLENAAEVAATGVDYLAVGALTHSAPALDLALDLR